MTRADFIDSWVFRVLSPIVTGTIVYLLILLLNNNIDQLLESFISDEYFVCIGLSLITLEVTRLILTYHERVSLGMTFYWAVLAFAMTILFAVVFLVIIVLSCYYNSIVGYQPNLSELQPFILLYIGLAIAYSSFFLSNFYLKKSLKSSLNEEEILAKQSKENFARVTRGLNPDLLFESLESIITLQHGSKDKADDLIDHLSIVYRYMLSKNQEKIISIEDEVYALKALTKLLNQLPYRQINIEYNIEHQIHIIPGTLMRIVELIVKSTIVRDDKHLNIVIQTTEESVAVNYTPHDKLISTLTADNIEDIISSYRIYCNQEITFQNIDSRRSVVIPNLNIQN